MASLHQLLAKGGGTFSRSQERVNVKDKVAPDESICLPIYICVDRKILEFPPERSTEKAFSRNGSSACSSRTGVSVSSGESNTRSTIQEGVPGSNEPGIDEAAVGAVISILGGYVGQYLRDEGIRETIRMKCLSCFSKRNKDSDNKNFSNLEIGIESIDKLVKGQLTRKEKLRQPLQNTIRLLRIVASLSSTTSRNGVPNPYLCACAHLYLSIAYKLEKNDRVSAKHLLQVFCESPFLARNHLLPELWEHLFLPHLLHLKIWQSKEFEFLSNLDYADKEKRMKAFSKVYNEQMDMGTAQFSLYYKQWLKEGARAPTVPYVPLPSIPSYTNPRRKSLDSFTTNSSTKNSLYKTVFGPNMELQSMHLDDRTGVSVRARASEEEEKACIGEDKSRLHVYSEDRAGANSRSSSQIYRKSRAELRHDVQKSDYFRLLTCRGEPTECLIQRTHMTSIGSKRKALTPCVLPSSGLTAAITTICSSDILSDCEMAIRKISKAWLDSHGDPTVEALLSRTPVIEGMLEVLFGSSDDEILELAVSILAELVSRKEIYGHVVLNSDPQLDIFTRLLKSSSLFLKAATLLYLLKPKAKQMISMDWIPLALRVLEFGDQLQTLFTVKCNPHTAAYYFLDQLLTGFDEDKNLENARQVVSLGGLSLLATRIETGDITEKNKAIFILCCCIRADGSCRNFLDNNLIKNSIIDLLVQRKQTGAHVFALLPELLCLHRTTQRTKLLNGILSGWGSMNTMHFLLVHLQKAPQEERPIAAALLLQLDLLGDPLKNSVYREEAVEAIVSGLDCQKFNEKVQEQSARALLVLGGSFTYSGQPAIERWMLEEAGFDECSADSFYGKDFIFGRFNHMHEEYEELKKWHRKAAIGLLSSGKTKFLAALSDSMANGIQCLARASLVTVSWLSSYLHTMADENLTCSNIVPRLVEYLNYDKTIEERVLASFTLLNLAKCSDFVPMILQLSKEQMGCLWNVSHITWTARDLLSIITSRSNF